MDDDAAVERPPQLVGKRRIGVAHADELGLAAGRRHLAARERGGVRRHRLERAVRVPELIARLVHHLSIRPVHQPVVVVGIDVGEIDHVRMQAIFPPGRVDRGLERPEAPAEGHLLLVGEVLTGKDEHGIFLEGVEDRAKRGLVERPGQIDALDTRAEAGVDRRDLHARPARTMDGFRIMQGSVATADDAVKRVEALR